jgi:hypothetical protein
LFDNVPGRETIDRAESLILRLRDVQSCRISTDELGKITEVHVVAASDRSPKLIARDVETMLKAELGLPIDYRKIGVVLIDSMKDTSAARRHDDRGTARSSIEERFEDIIDRKLKERDEAKQTPPAPATVPDAGPSIGAPDLEFLEEDARVVFKGVTLSIDESRVDAEVRLCKNKLEVTGCMGGLRSSGPIYEMIAGAAVHALTELLDESFHLCLSEIKEVSLSGRKALIAVVDMIDGRAVKGFAGCVFLSQDPNEAAVLAVLDAVNRAFGRWKSRKEIHYTIR